VPKTRDAELVVAKECVLRIARGEQPAVPKKGYRKNEYGEAIFVLTKRDEVPWKG
jgi:hypothetical protein